MKNPPFDSLVIRRALTEPPKGKLFTTLIRPEEKNKQTQLVHSLAQALTLTLTLTLTLNHLVNKPQREGKHTIRSNVFNPRQHNGL